jgi:hypothetical protein
MIEQEASDNSGISGTAWSTLACKTVNTFFPGHIHFKTEGQEQAVATLGLLGLPAGIGYEQVLASLSGGALTRSGVAGECIMRDGQHGPLRRERPVCGG